MPSKADAKAIARAWKNRAAMGSVVPISRVVKAIARARMASVARVTVRVLKGNAVKATVHVPKANVVPMHRAKVEIAVRKANAVS